MSKCVDQSFPCQSPNYSKFDDVTKLELRDPPPANDIVNESTFCTVVPIDEAIQLGDLTHKSYLKSLRNKVGLYHLWISYDHCDDHDTHTMLCVYVGKGLAEARINSHIKSKWKSETLLYVSFYECSNRMSKYLEQLFLDTYKFHLNSNENTGVEDLFGVWSDGRYSMGTEIYAISQLNGIESLDDIL